MARVLRYIARTILVAFATLAFLFALLSGAEQQGGGFMGLVRNSPNALPWLLLFGLVFVAWRWELVGGLVIIIAGVGGIFFFNLLEQGWLPFLIMGLPSIVLGGMLVAAHFLGEREKEKHEHKKIIALSSSPSKGRNSDTMLDSFIKGVEKVPDLTVEKVYLIDIPFDHYAYENKGGPKPHEKEFADLINKVRSSEGLIIATPTYNFSVPAQLKNFIDRIRFFALDFENMTRLHQPVGRLGNLRLYFLVSGGTPTWAQKILFFAFPPFWLRGVFLYYGANCMGAIYSGDVRTFENESVLKKCERAGEKFAYQVMECKCHGLLERIFWRPPQKD